MAPKKQQKKKVQYYTIVFEKYLEVLGEVNSFHFYLSDRIKDLTKEIPIDSWSESPLPDLMDSFVLVDSYRIFLDEKINNPSDEEIKFTTENNIKDVLFDEEELKAMQKFYIMMEEKRRILYEVHNLSTEVN